MSENQVHHSTKNSLRYIPHYYLPGLHTYLMNDISTSDEAIQYYSVPETFGLPTPYVAFSEIKSKINAVLDLVNLKIRWNFERNQILKNCRKKLSSSSLIALKKSLKSECSYPEIPHLLSSLTTNLMENPDEYFDCDYNWYFKNTLDKFQINGKWYLAYARGTNLDTLDVISIDDNKLGVLISSKDKFFNGPIFDIKSSNTNDLMIRQKTKLFVFWNNSDTESLLNKNSTFENSDIPFADSDITNNNFCSVDVKHIVKLWESGNCIQEKHFDVASDQTDSFVRLNYLQNQTDLIGIINREKFYFIDTRIDMSRPCSIYDPSSIIEQCEELISLKNSNLNFHSFYVTSNHSVLTLDNRMGFVHKAYHMLSTPPSLITSHCYENSLEPCEMLFLGSQTGESLVNLSYTSYQDDFLLCRHMASLIPKPLDTLHNVRFQGHCLDPTLFDRFSQCLIGTTALGDNSENLRLFSINSTGDLFVQTIKNNRPINIKEFKNRVTIKPQTVQMLNYSLVFDMSKLWQIESSDKHNDNIQKNNAWRMSKEKMTSYIDHLAPLILAPWDIEELSEWENEDEIDDAENDNSDCDFTTKVNFWFDKNNSLLGSSQPLDTNMDNLSINISSQATTLKAPPSSENDDDSSSGFTISLKSDDNL